MSSHPPPRVAFYGRTAGDSADTTSLVLERQ
jgi:hypothetical protein